MVRCMNEVAERHAAFMVFCFSRFIRVSSLSLLLLDNILTKLRCKFVSHLFYTFSAFYFSVSRFSSFTEYYFALERIFVVLPSRRLPPYLMWTGPDRGSDWAVRETPMTKLRNWALGGGMTVDRLQPHLTKKIACITLHTSLFSVGAVAAGSAKSYYALFITLNLLHYLSCFDSISELP